MLFAYSPVIGILIIVTVSYDFMSASLGSVMYSYAEVLDVSSAAVLGANTAAKSVTGRSFVCFSLFCNFAVNSGHNVA